MCGRDLLVEELCGIGAQRLPVLRLGHFLHTSQPVENSGREVHAGDGRVINHGRRETSPRAHADANLALAREAQQIDLHHPARQTIALPAAQAHEVLVERLDAHRLAVIGQFVLDECLHRPRVGILRDIELAIGAAPHDLETEAEVFGGINILIAFDALRDRAGTHNAVDDLDAFLLAEDEGRVEGDVARFVGRGEHAVDQRLERAGELLASDMERHLRVIECVHPPTGIALVHDASNPAHLGLQRLRYPSNDGDGVLALLAAPVCDKLAVGGEVE